MVKMAEETAAPGVLPADRAQARELRQRYGFLREVVAEMERVVPYAAALVSGADGVRLSLRDGEQQAGRRDPQLGIVLTAVSGDHLEEVATDAIDPDSVRRAAQELVARASVAGTGLGHAADRPRARNPGRGLRHAGGARSRAGDAGAEAGALRGPAPAAAGARPARGASHGPLRGRGGDEGLRQPQPVRDRDHPPRARGPHPLRLGRAAAPLRLAQRGGHGGPGAGRRGGRRPGADAGHGGGPAGGQARPAGDLRRGHRPRRLRRPGP